MNVPQHIKARGKAEKPQKGKTMNSNTKIVGWTKKKAFSGVIDGRKIESPEKIVLQLVQRVNNEECHGEMVDTVQIPTVNAINMNNGSENFDKFIGCNVILNYQVFNGKQQLVDIIVINADGTLFTAPKK